MRRLFLLLFFLGAASAQPQYDVVLVRSDLPFEWIVAQVYAHSSGVPIVTTHSDRLDKDAKEELLGYLEAGYNRLVILGGEQAVSPWIKMQLDEMGFLTHRISEGDRYGTSARVAIELFGTTDVAVVAGGEGYEGLLIAKRIASSLEAPILFVKRTSIPPSVKDALESLGVKRVYIVEKGLDKKIIAELKKQGYSVVIAEKKVKLEGEGLPKSFTFFVIGVLTGGLLLFTIYKYREREVKKQVPYTILTEDEEKVVRAILDSGGTITQDKLPEKTDFSRPKISRIIADLSVRGIIVKERHGRTQKLIISRDFYEEKDV